MKNLNIELDKLDFHDSYIDGFKFSETGILEIYIHYYNWEGNVESKDVWTYKKLLIKVDKCISFKFQSPGLGMSDQEIYSHETLKRIENFEPKEIENFAKERKVEAFQNWIDIRLLTHSFGKKVFDEPKGFLEVGGFDAKLIWLENSMQGNPIHIPT